MASDGDKERKEEGAGVADEDAPKERSVALVLAEALFRLGLPDELVPEAEKGDLRRMVVDEAEKRSMVAFLRHVCALPSAGIAVDEAKLAAMEEKNAARLQELDAALAEAREKDGASEVREAMLARADFLAETATRQVAAAAYEETYKITVGSGLKVDLVLSIVRLGMLYGDSEMSRAQTVRAKELVESGADWERRNLLKVYEAVQLIGARDIKKAAALLLDSIATFTCTELFEYNTFIFYTAVAAVMSVDRTTLRDKVIRAPEVLTTYHELPHVQQFLESLYECRYKDFLRALAAMMPAVQRDMHFAPHFAYAMREIRVVVYRQYLQAYRSVKLESMASAFGLSPQFLDNELSRFIASGRINCKIDKVNGVVETNRPDKKNAQYHETIKHGDVLLARVQKLTKAINA